MKSICNKFISMDKVCPVLIVLLVLLVLYICACFVAIGILCNYPEDSQPKYDLSNSKDSGIDESRGRN